MIIVLIANYYMFKSNCLGSVFKLNVFIAYQLICIWKFGVYAGRESTKFENL